MNIATSIFAFVCALAAVCMFLIGFFVLTRDERSAAEWYLVSYLLSVVVTVMIVLLGLHDVNKIEGNWSRYTVTLTGSVVVFIIVSRITKRGFREFLKFRSGDFSVDAKPQQIQPKGFVRYNDWLHGLGKVRSVIKGAETHFINDLLKNIDYYGPDTICKPERVEIATAFFFFGFSSVKFQRIQGRVRYNQKMPTAIYLPYTPSRPDGLISCLQFIRDGNRIRETLSNRHGEWVEAPSEEIDLLILAVYENDYIEDGDYVYIDTTKYVDFDKDDKAAIKLAIASDTRIEGFKVWEVMAVRETRKKDSQLMFQERYRELRQSSDQVIERRYGEVAEMFNGWDELLDQASARDADRTAEFANKKDEDLLVRAKKILARGLDENLTFKELLRRPPTDCVTREINHEQNPILLTFAWDPKRHSG